MGRCGSCTARRVLHVGRRDDVPPGMPRRGRARNGLDLAVGTLSVEITRMVIDGRVWAGVDELAISSLSPALALA